jgi:hypothetical protein
MTMRLSILIDADGKIAQAEIRKLGEEVRKTGAASETMAKGARTAATGAQQLGRASGSAAAQTDALSAAQRRNAATAQQMQAANNGAAGSMGNLVAQFNDIGMMMAAGQNPLMLAVQQGTQISQVIGPMGAAGAVKALGGAFMGMLNPLSLVTIGVIAGGAALFQWARSAIGAGGDAEEFEDKLSRLNEAVGTYRELSDLANSSTAALGERFGSASTAIGPVADFLAEVAKIDAVRELDGALGSLTEQFGGLSRTAMQVTRDGMIPEIDETFFNLRDEMNLTDQQAAAVVRSLEELSTAGSLSEKIAAAENLQQAFVRVFGSIEQIPVALLDVARDAGVVALSVGEIEQAIEGATAAENEFVNVLELRLARAIEGEEAFARSQAAGATILADLQAQKEELSFIRLFGEESAEVATLRAAREREVFASMVDTLGVTEQQTAELLNSYDAVVLLSQTDPSGYISLAADEAARAAANLGLALDYAGQLSASQGTGPAPALSFGLPGTGVAPSEGLSFGRLPGPDRPATNASVLRRAPRAGASSAGGAGGSAAAEVDAVQQLIASLQEELDVLGEIDPVLQEMRTHRETLAGATDAETAQVRSLIEARIDEQAVLEAQAAQWDFLRESAYSAFEEFRRTGDVNAMLANMADRLADAAFQATLLGEGPLAMLLGGGKGGGLIGMAISAIAPGLASGGQKLAGGGPVYGAGGGTDDKVPLMASPGEFMINAKAASQHRHLLEAINAGMPLMALAAGGPVGMGPYGSGSFGGPVINIMNNSSVPIQGQIEETREPGGGRSYRLVVADEVGQALQTKGGGADRALKRGFGVRRRGVNR